MCPLSDCNIKFLETWPLGGFDFHPLGHGLGEGLDGQPPELEEG